MRRFIEIAEGVYYRGSRDEPKRTRRPSLSFTDDPDVASVYSADPGTGNYALGSRVSKATFDLKNPLDFSQSDEVSLSAALNAVGIRDPLAHFEDVRKVVYFLWALDDKGVPFNFKLAGRRDWQELYRDLTKAAQDDEDGEIDDLLSWSFVDVYALADTKTYTRLAKQAGFDGMIYQDVFDGGSRMAKTLLGKTKPDRHLTYRPFGNIEWLPPSAR